MILTSPLMLLGLAALPVLAAVYWLRSRSQREVVSCLAFWIDQRNPRRGGRILHRMQTPLAFFLELLAIALLVLAAAGPAILNRDVVRPVTLVLDDSYSMQARRGKQSFRDRAAAAILDEMRNNKYVVRIILAGAQPRMVGRPARDADQLQEVLADWTCRSPTADLPAAISLASEAGDRGTRILVVSDHPPTGELENGRVEWRSFGEKLPNMAFITAVRSPGAENERALLELACLSDAPARTTLNVRCSEQNELATSAVALKAGEVKQTIMNLPHGSPPLNVSIDDDALTIDNQVVLLPEEAKPVRVAVSIAADALRKPVLAALGATGGAIVVKERPELIVSDGPGEPAGEAWRMEIVGGSDAQAFAGPFVIDRNQDLTEGLSLQSVVWAASPQFQTAGIPLAMAGNVPLLVETADAAGRRLLRMNFDAKLSNLQDSPDWPILFVNVVRWRRRGLPGAAEPNVRLGQTIEALLPKVPERVEVVLPDESVRKIEPRGRRVTTPAERVGLYAIKTPDAEYAFSCNAISRDESDLSGCRSGRWGNWNDSPIYQDRRISLGWIFLVVAVAAMSGHLALIGKREDGLDGNR